MAIGDWRARRLHVEKHVFDVARVVEMLQGLGEAFYMVFCKNQAMLGDQIIGSERFACSDQPSKLVEPPSIVGRR